MGYVKVFLNQLVKHKLFSIIIVTGLSIGLASCLVLTLYIKDELSYDRHHPGAERIYRISNTLNTGDEVLDISGNSPQVAALLKENFPEVEDSVRTLRRQFYISGEQTPDSGSYERNLYFADNNFFSFFSYKWLSGDPDKALSEPDTIVVTESFAKRYFGEENPYGKTLFLNGSRPLKVTGLLSDRSGNSYLEADAFISMNVLEDFTPPGYFDNWFSLDFSTFIRLEKGTDFEALRPRLFDFIVENRPDQANSIFELDSDPLTEIYLSQGANPWSDRSRADDLYILSGICAGLLIIGCINFINLATARTSERLKEIAIRKVAGSRQQQIFLQHMGESAAMVLIAFLIAIGLMELSLPLINAYTEKQFVTSDLWAIWPMLVSFGLFVTVCAGAYPAFYLSNARPLAVIREKYNAVHGRFSLRNLLVICQFSIAIMLIIATLVMFDQLRFARNIELGFDKERVLVIENRSLTDWDILRQQLLETPGVEAVSGAVGSPFQPMASSSLVRYEGMELDSDNLSQFNADINYFRFFGVDLLTGRYFSDDFGTDRLNPPTEDNPHPSAAFMMNRAMVEKLGWTPESAIGKRFEMSFAGGFDQSSIGEVVGVVENMQTDSVRREVVPRFYVVSPRGAGYGFTFVKLAPGDISSRVEAVKATWSSVFPGRPINQYFLDSTFQRLYEVEEHQTALVSGFAILTVIISCMGLLGLAAYTTEKRIKEIGIRKVVGATVMQIVTLLSYDFSKLVLVSNFIAWPVAYFAMNRWLENFAYRIDLTPLIFIGSGLIALCIAWVTVGGTAAKAASRKPVLALRYE